MKALTLSELKDINKELNILQRFYNDIGYSEKIIKIINLTSAITDHIIDMNLTNK